MAEPVTDPALLAQLNAPVSDPELLKELNAPAREKHGAGRAFSQGAAEGLSLNWNDELRALAEASGTPLSGSKTGALAQLIIGATRYLSGDEDAHKRHDEALAKARELSRQVWEDQPVAAAAGNVTGSLALPGGGLARGATLPLRIGKGALAGSLYGAAAGAGAGEDTQSRIGGGAVGAGIGGVVGGALGGAFGGRPAPAVPGSAVAEAADRLGVQVPRGLLSDSPTVQMTTQAARQLPIVGGMAEDAVAGASRGLDQAAEQAASRMGATPGDRAQVGAQARGAIEQGVERMFDRANGAYNRVRSMIQPDANVQLPNNVVETLDRIVRERVAAGETGIPIQGLTNSVELLTRPGGASFNGLQRARSELGKAISWDERNGGFIAGDLKRAYNSLSDTMEQAVRSTASNPDDAVAALERANQLFGRVTGEGRDLQRFLGQGSDERIMDRVLSFASDKAGGDISRLNLLRRSMTPGEWNNVAANLVQRLGLNDANEFSPSFFVKRYQNMSERGREMLFGAPGTQTRQYIDDMATVSTRLRDTGRFANTSNTARAALLGTGAVAATADAYHDPMETMQHGLMLGGVSIPIALLLTRPATAASMARWSSAYRNLVERPTRATMASFNVASRNLGQTVSQATGITVDPRAFAAAASEGRSSAQQPQPGAP